MKFEEKLDFIVKNCPKPIKWWKIESSNDPIEIFIVLPYQKSMKRVYSRLKTWEQLIHHHTNLKPRR